MKRIVNVSGGGGVLVLAGVVLVAQSLAHPGTPSMGAPLPTRIQVLETGAFHGDEVTARSGEWWLGLSVTPSGSSLVPTPLTVRRVHDPIMDHGSRDKSGKAVLVKGRSKPVFLVRGAGTLRAGSVAAARARATPLTGQSDLSLQLAGKEYRLQVLTNRAGNGDGIGPDARLVLTQGKRSQVLYDCGGDADFEGGAGWRLMWAGDLDRDGGLDLYVIVSDHYNVTERKLFLSSPAKRGRLVHEAAEFRTVGC